MAHYAYTSRIHITHYHTLQIIHYTLHITLLHITHYTYTPYTHYTLQITHYIHTHHRICTLHIYITHYTSLHIITHDTLHMVYIVYSS